MSTNTADPAIYINDTVRTIREGNTPGTAHWIVESIDPATGTAEISRTTGRLGSYRHTSRPWPVAKLALVRHGNKDDDAVRQLTGYARANRADRGANPYILDGRAHAPTGQ